MTIVFKQQDHFYKKKHTQTKKTHNSEITSKQSFKYHE